MATLSLPRGRRALHVMPTSAGHDVQASSHYDWDGRKRGQMPFTILQHTIAGAGHMVAGDVNDRFTDGVVAFLDRNYKPSR